MRIFVISSLIILVLSGCAASRIQTDAGTMSVDKGKAFSNTSLVYSANNLGMCSVVDAIATEEGTYSIPLDRNKVSIVCRKGDVSKELRVVAPMFWETKYKKNRRNMMASSLIFGGPLGLAVVAAGNPSAPTLEEVQEMFKIYPPYIAVVGRPSSRKEREQVWAEMVQKYASYADALPSDCEKITQKEFNAICNEATIAQLKEREKKYLESVR
jgi:hypothetical protein